MAINKDEDVVDTADYKLDKHGRKIKAHRIVFNKGEDDGNKGIKEGSMKKSYNQFIEEHTLELSEEQLNELVAELQEVLGKDAKAGEWISDFVHSDNPKFAGKSKEKRKQMALAAFYAKQRNEAYSGNPAREGMIAAGGGSPAERGAWAAKQEGKKKEDEKKSEKKEVKEELKGGQVKLDENKNGKLDAEDFKKLRKEEVEQLLEDICELMEAYDPEDYEATSEKSKFGGHRAVLKHKTKGHTSYVGGASYKTAEHAKGEAETYRKHYSVGHSKVTPGTNMRHDRAVSEYRKKAKEAGHIHESWDAMLAHVKKTGEASKTSTATKHDVKRTSTGTVYTKQRDADGMSKEFKRDPDQAKRGRGRPKKNSFSEAAEFLMSLSEEQFNDVTSEGFDIFFKSFENINK